MIEFSKLVGYDEFLNQSSISNEANVNVTEMFYVIEPKFIFWHESISTLKCLHLIYCLKTDSFIGLLLSSEKMMIVMA